ncbi:abortive phage infection protein [Streptomyces sp. NPDC059063]|uniref:abortive phage infection protein n=1 Tax=unclassified Streptomyces TaxID=2593676 RepID=UPI0036B3A33A
MTFDVRTTDVRTTEPRATGTATAAEMSRAAFLRRAAVMGILASAGALTATTPAAARAASGRRPPGRGGLTHRGVCYDTGTDFTADGELTRPLWSQAILATDLRAIHQGLHCNAVTLLGTDVGRLTEAASCALERGLHVLVQPRPFDRPQREILDHLARTARAAERLRAHRGPEVILVVGCEYLFFAPGIVPGATFLDRMRYLAEETYDIRVFLRRLNAFLAKAAAVARRHFHGRISYGAAAGLEEIDWSPFDVVGLDYYAYHREPAAHTRELARYRRWRKPITIVETGCCTYEGAAQRGRDGWDVVDYEGDVPVIEGGLVRSEREQARHLAFMLAVFEAEGLLGASPYQFIDCESPHHATAPKYDLDMAGYGLVKVIREDHLDPASPYRWEPKRSFHAVAAHHARALRRRS